MKKLILDCVQKAVSIMLTALLLLPTISFEVFAEDPKVSIIIPVYNTPQNLLRDCLESAKNQTLKDIEIICVDDGSTDDSGKILDEYANSDQRFVVVHKPNGGCSSARDRGMDLAKGEYIQFLDSDDTIDPTTSEKCYNAAKEYDADIVKFPRIFDNSCYNKGTISDLVGKYKLFSNCSNGVYRSKFLRDNNLRFGKLAQAGECSFFNILAGALSKKTAVIPDKLYNYVCNYESSTHVETKSDRFKKLVENIKLTKQILKDRKLFERDDVKLAFVRFSFIRKRLCDPYSDDEIFVKALGSELLTDEVINQLPYMEAYSIKLMLQSVKDQFLQQLPQILKKYYRDKFGRNLNLENPKTYSEKVQWLKLYDSTPIKTKIADKYLVKDWIKEKVGEKYVVPLLGVWDKFDDINFDKLPNKFVLKTNHGYGCNIFVEDKSEFDKEAAKAKLDRWLNMDYTFESVLELYYHNIKPKIIAEPYLENSKSDVYGYKVFCFDGKPRYTMIMTEKTYDRYSTAFYDNMWKLQPFKESARRKYDKLVDKPENLSEMLNVAEILSNGFCCNNIDFFVLNDGSIKIFEMEFSHGWLHFADYEHNKLFGDLVTLPKEKYDYRKIFESDGANKLGETKKDADKPSSKTLDDGVYVISSKLDPNMCLDIKSSSKNNKANLQLWQRNGTNAQKFQVQYNSDGYYTIKAICSGKFIDVSASGKRNGTNIWQYSENGTDAQKWFIVPDGEGYYCLVSKCNNLCMDDSSVKAKNGANIHCWSMHAEDNQKFKFEKCEDKPSSSKPGDSKKSA